MPGCADETSKGIQRVLQVSGAAATGGVVPADDRLEINTQAQVSVTGTSAEIVAAITTRRVLILVNESTTETAYLSFDGTAATTSDFALLPGASLNFTKEPDSLMMTGAILAIRGGSDNLNVSILQFVIT